MTNNGGSLTLNGVIAGMRHFLPIALFVIPFGIGFGMAGMETGLGSSLAVLSSILTFSGAAQFATLDLVLSGTSWLALIAVALTINARYVVMSAALAPWVRTVSPGKRYLALALMTDANFADSYSAYRRGERDLGFFLGGGLIVLICWVAGTAIGVTGGNALGQPERLGLDLVMPCFFAAVAGGNLQDGTTRLPSLLAAIVAVAAIGLLPLGWNIIAGAVVGGVIGGLIYGHGVKHAD